MRTRVPSETVTAFVLALCLAAPGAQGDPAAEVLAFERQIEEAVVRGDVAFFDQATPSDFSFVHGDGWTTGGKPLMSDDKAAFLKRVADKEYLVHDLDNVKVELHGDVGLVRACLREAQRPVAVPVPPHRARAESRAGWHRRHRRARQVAGFSAMRRRRSGDSGHGLRFQHLHLYQMTARIQELDDDQCDSGE